ncbi:hypothetical protein DI396_15585 [Litorivita pollutaquae]|uniref:O-antigen ligase like membrane protein n=1 Tax=Litorivita pollutaquae TaxID=2200892 RepID=A0A2V4MQP2_9RHOB|nr:hypothetical protein [Litorivita pollutaquae]PYC46418.1 hypothetical protein DI396_15585 [Litorivita pollutaquae]
MPNAIAYIALFGFPLVAAFLFRRFTLMQAAVLTVLIGYLFLPEKTGVNLPVLPTIDKKSMPAICALIFAALKMKTERRLAIRRGAPVVSVGAETKEDRTPLGRRAAPSRAAPQQRSAQTTHRKATPSARSVTPPSSMPVTKAPNGKLVYLIIGILLFSTIITFLTNRSGLTYGPLRLPAIRPYDMPAMMLNFVIMLLPFWIGWRYLRRPEASRTLLRMLALTGVAYACLVLFEVRMAPQLNTWIYGFFPHSFAQHMRAGGFRPIVFLAHGLRIGIYLSFAVLAAASLMRLEETSRARMLWGLATGFLLLTLLVSKNLGATGITILMLGAVFLMPQRMKLLFAATISAVVLFYPMARAIDVVPTTTLVEWAAKVSPERAQSLNFRFEQENVLLDRAAQKPIAGWGAWGRARVYDAETGKDLSVTDGTWIIFFGNHGWIGYLCVFGLLCLIPIRLMLRRTQLNPSSYDIGLVLVLTAGLIDLLPNSSLVPPLWLITGALWGRYGALRQDIENRQAHQGIEPNDMGMSRAGPRSDPSRRIRKSNPDRPSPSPRA